MNFIFNILILVVAVAALFTLANWMGWVRVGWFDELLKSWTARVNGLALLLLSWFQSDPLQVLAVWNMMPSAVRDFLPNSPVVAIGLLLFVMSLWARVRAKKGA